MALHARHPLLQRRVVSRSATAQQNGVAATAAASSSIWGAQKTSGRTGDG